MTEEIGVGKSPQDFTRYVLAESSQAHDFLIQFFSGDLCCGTEADDACDVLCSRAQTAFLAASEYDWRELRALADIQRAHAFRAMQLVRGE